MNERSRSCRGLWCNSDVEWFWHSFTYEAGSGIDLRFVFPRLFEVVAFIGNSNYLLAVLGLLDLVVISWPESLQLAISVCAAANLNFEIFKVCLPLNYLDLRTGKVRVWVGCLDNELRL